MLPNKRHANSQIPHADSDAPVADGSGMSLDFMRDRIEAMIRQIPDNMIEIVYWILVRATCS